MMIKVHDACYVNALEVSLIRLTDKKRIQIFLISGPEVEISERTEEWREKLFHLLAKNIDTIQWHHSKRGSK